MVCGGKRRGRARLRAIARGQDEVYENYECPGSAAKHLLDRKEASGSRQRRSYIGQEASYEQTLPPGPFKRGISPLSRDYDAVVRKRRKAPEASFQIDVAKYLAKALPEGFFFTTFPSGGGGRIRGARLKQQGLKPGMPDMMVLRPQYDPDDGNFGAAETLWLELKAKSGSLSQAQKDVHKQLKALGHQVVTVKTLEQVQDALAEFCFPEKLRARVTV